MMANATPYKFVETYDVTKALWRCWKCRALLTTVAPFEPPDTCFKCKTTVPAR